MSYGEVAMSSYSVMKYEVIHDMPNHQRDHATMVILFPGEGPEEQKELHFAA